MAEYHFLMEAVRLKQVDMDYRNHLQAFLNFVVKAEKKVGKNRTKPVYQRFKKFYDYESAEAEARNATKKRSEKSRFSGVGKFLKIGEKEYG